jgi:subtilisin family serine protease
VGGTFDPISFGAFYSCVHATWTFEVQTQDTWAQNSLGDWQVFIDTDGNFSDNCFGNEYLAFVSQSTPGAFVAEVEAVNSSCQPIGTPISLPASFFTITANSVALTFPSSVIGSSNTLVWNGLLQSRSEEVTTNGGDLVPSNTSFDGFIQGGIADSLPGNPPTCTAAATGVSSTLVATTSDSHRAAALLRQAGFGQVHDYGHGIVSFTGDRSAAQSLLGTANLGTQVAPGQTFKPATITSPNDPGYVNGSQWNLGVIGATGAWSVTNGNGVVVADIDTGVDYTHPDLHANLLPGFDETTGMAMSGTNTDTGQTDAGHGTAVAGVIAAATNNSTGLASLGFNTKVLPIKVNFDDQAHISAQIGAGINWAAANGARIINLSLGGPCPDSTIQKAIQNAQNAGILVVAAAGNGALNTNLDPANGTNDAPSYPANYSGVIAVGATGHDGFRAAYSNTSSYVSMVAPGGSAIPGDAADDIPLLAPGFKPSIPGSGYTTGAGTSFAAPQVAAAAALIWAENSSLTASQVTGLVEASTTDLGVSGTDLAYGGGMENARIALADAGPLARLVLSPAAATVKAGTAQVYTDTGLDGTGTSLGDFTSATSFTIAPNGSGTGASCDNTAKTCSATLPGIYTVTGTQSGRTGTATLIVLAMSGETVSSWASGRLDVFTRGADNAIWHASFSGGWSGWDSLGGVASSSPAAVSWGPNRIDLFVMGSDGNLWHKWWGPGWSNWVTELFHPPPGIAAGSSPVVSSWAPGRLDVFVRGADNAIWHASFSGGWSGWDSLGGVASSSPAAVSWGPNRIDLFVMGSDGNLWHKWWGPGWSNWVTELFHPPPGIA